MSEDELRDDDGGTRVEDTSALPPHLAALVGSLRGPEDLAHCPWCGAPSHHMCL